MLNVDGMQHKKSEETVAAISQGVTGAEGMPGVSPEIDTGGATQVDVPVLHVLVVDDDAKIREMCVGVAARMGCAVVQAESVPAAQQILKFQKIDLLLLDLRLPGGG